MQVTKLKGFKTAKAKMQVHMYKHLSLTIIEYPQFPIHGILYSLVELFCYLISLILIKLQLLLFSQILR